MKGLKLDFSVLIIRKYTGFNCKNNCFLGVNVIQNKDVKGTKNYIHTTIYQLISLGNKSHKEISLLLHSCLEYHHEFHS